MDTEDKFYCVSGMEDFIDQDNYPRINTDEDSRILAKSLGCTKSKNILESKNIYRYYILVNENGTPYNPVLLHSSVKNKKNYTDVICKGKQFKKVDSYIFKKYINFLKTKNKKILTDLQRDM
jgi:hypothetical protein